MYAVSHRLVVKTPGKPIETFGAMLRRLRAERNKMSLEALAEKIGVSHVAVGDWERGKRNPKRENVVAVAAALELTDAVTNQLLGLAGFSGMADGAGNDIVLSIGRTARIEARSGDPSKPFMISPQILAVIEALIKTEEAEGDASKG